jgi:hypothetical protein
MVLIRRCDTFLLGLGAGFGFWLLACCYPAASGRLVDRFGSPSHGGTLGDSRFRVLLCHDHCRCSQEQCSKEDLHTGRLA